MEIYRNLLKGVNNFRFFIYTNFYLFLFISTLFISSCTKSPSSIKKACINAACFNVELAQTEEELKQGLQERPSLAEDEGMLFIFGVDAQHPFWMKNTLIPLDMIWIDEHLKVVYIEHHANPCWESACPIYGTEQSSRYVLEVGAGLAQKYHFNIGDAITFEYN